MQYCTVVIVYTLWVTLISPPYPSSGVNYGERGSAQQSLEFFSQSMKLKPNVIAARCIAVQQVGVL